MITGMICFEVSEVAETIALSTKLWELDADNYEGSYSILNSFLG